MQTRPIRDKTRDRQPDEADVPTITLGDTAHDLAHEERCCGKSKQEADLTFDPFPVEQDDCEHAPDGNVIQARVAQDTLPEWLPQDLEFFHEKDEDRQSGHGASHANAENELPSV